MIGPGLGRRQHRIDVEDLAAADRLAPTALAEHVTVTAHERKGGGEVHASQAATGRVRDGRRRADGRARCTARRRCARETRRAARRRGRDRGPISSVQSIAVARAHCAGRTSASPRAHLGVGDAGQVDRERGGRGPIVVCCCLWLCKPAHPHAVAARVRHQLVVDRQTAAGERSGDHRARAACGEGPVDPEARAARSGSSGGTRRTTSASPSIRSFHTEAGERDRPARFRRRRGTCRQRARPPRAAPTRARRRRPARPWSSATTPVVTPSRSRMRRCSSDCGFQPSVAATTKRHASIAPTPASMLLMKRT